MTLYVDSSALLKRYVDEHDSAVAETLMSDDPVLVTTRLTEVEVRRSLTRLLEGDRLIDARRSLAADLDAFALVALDATTMNEAARVAEQTMCRSLDAVHIGAARRAGSSTRLLTFDHRQAAAARALGLTVLGV
jgi:uncharacterized protein